MSEDEDFGEDVQYVEHLVGCKDCGCWGVDEAGQLMCPCDTVKYNRMHPPIAGD